MSTDETVKPLEKVARVQTATRDLEEARVRLEAWLAGRLPGTDPSVATPTTTAANGMSSETLLFEATWTEAGARRPRRLAARVAPDPANLPVFPHYDLEAQFRVLREVHELGVAPVPVVRWSEPDPAHLGAPFFVMDQVNGIVPPDVMPYDFGDSWVSDASPEQLARLQESSVRVLAALHSIDRPEERFGYLAPPGDPGTGTLRRHVEAARRYHRWVAVERPIPLLDRAFAWLDDHWPEHEGPSVLSWGDARIGNLMFRDFEVVAVLDWEMASLAPPELDLGWFVFLHRFFEDLAWKYGLPGLPRLLRRDDVARRYAELTGHEPADLEWYIAYAAVRQGSIMSRVRIRQAHFGEAELPEDPDDLVHHRTSLEAMLDGTYWPAVDERLNQT